MIDFIKKHNAVLEGKLSENFTAKQKEDLWNKLIEILNADGQGPKKTPVKWRKTWIDLKSDTKLKAAARKNYEGKTGGGPPPPPLTPIQEMVCELLDPVLIEGDVNVIETGRYNEEGVVESTAAAIPDVYQHAVDYIEQPAADCVTEEPAASHPQEKQTNEKNQERGKKRKESESTNDRMPKVSRKRFTDLVESESEKVKAFQDLSVVYREAQCTYGSRSPIEGERTVVKREE